MPSSRDDDLARREEGQTETCMMVLRSECEHSSQTRSHAKRPTSHNGISDGTQPRWRPNPSRISNVRARQRAWEKQCFFVVYRQGESERRADEFIITTENANTAERESDFRRVGFDPPSGAAPQNLYTHNRSLYMNKFPYTTVQEFGITVIQSFFPCAIKFNLFLLGSHFWDGPNQNFEVTRNPAYHSEN